MAIPVATTTISVLRAPRSLPVDDFDAPSVGEFDTVATGVRATLGATTGVKVSGNGTRQELTVRFGCDPTTLGFTDKVLDESTGVTYDVVWAHARTGLGIDHVEGELVLVTGEL